MGTFKGFKVVSPTGFTEASADKDILYLVRTSGEKGAGTDGYLYFNHKKYGTAADAKAALITRYGDIKVGEKEVTISEYVAEQLKDIKGVTKDAFDALTGRVDTLETVVGNDKEGLVKSVADNAAAIENLNGDETVDGSVKKAVANAKSALVGDDKTEDTIKYAEKLANDAKTAASNEETRAKGVEAGLRTDVDKKVASVAGADAIITAGTATAPVVKLKLADTQGNVVLSQDTDGLKASVDLSAFGVKGVATDDKVLAVTKNTGLLSSTIKFSVDTVADTENKKYLRLTGIDGADLGKVDIAEFVKDGMLDTAVYSSTTHKITLTFNTAAGKDAIELDLHDLVDTYKAGDGLKLVEDGTFSVTDDVVRQAALNTLSGSVVANKEAIEKLNGDAKTEGSVAGVVSAAKTELLGDASGTGNTIGKVEAAVNDLKTQIADGAVTLKIEDPYLAVGQTGSTYEISTKIQAVKDASDTAKGLAEASDVKKYVDDTVADKVAKKNVAAIGDTLVSASAADNKVTVAATTALTSAVEKANSAVQKVNEKSGTAVTLDDSDIALSAAISDQAKGTKVNAVLADIYSKIGLVKVSSTNKTITVDTTGRIVDVNTESVANAQAAGHVALEHGDDGALYGVMYYSGDDAE